MQDSNALCCKNLKASSNPRLQKLLIIFLNIKDCLNLYNVYPESTSASGGRRTLPSLKRFSKVTSIEVFAILTCKDHSDEIDKHLLIISYCEILGDTFILRADVSTTTEGGNCDCLIVQNRKIVAETTIWFY